MTIELEVAGDRYTQFISATVSLRMDSLSNTYHFDATSTGGRALPFTGGESCRVIVDGEAVLTGSIEIVEVDYTSDSHSISISGRDKTGDLLDSTLDSISDITPPITLKQLIETIIEKQGLDIEVIDEVSPEPFNKAEDKFSPDPGKNAFSFLETYARKRQVLLESNGDGNIVIIRSTGTVSDSVLRMVVGSNTNNVIQGNVSYDTTGRFNIYKFVSGLNALAINFSGKIPISSLVSQKGQFIDDDVRKGRQLILVAEGAFSDTQNVDRAKWEANIRKARGRVYSAKVKGFRGSSGSLWNTNTLVSVVDDFAGINATMLINSVTYSLNLENGSTTTLGLVNRNAYSLSLQEPKVEKIGSGLFS